MPIDHLVEQSREFLSRQKAHIDRENKLIYPLFERYLTLEDWTAIEEKVSKQADPLFGELVKADYESLYQHIVASEHASKTPGHVLDQHLGCTKVLH